jgi:kinesin family protein 3/17
VWHNFTFDYVYDPSATQNFLYDNTAKPAVISVLEGYNATMLAYGQTGTGKTYTMEGFKYSGCDPQRGIVPRSMEQIFKYIEASANRNTTFMVRASYLQIYNEVISDLLKTDRTSLNIREDKKKGIFVEGLSEWAVRSPNEIYSLMQKGAMSRKTAWTNKNDVSSRSHAVFIIIVEQMKTIDGSKQVKVGKLNLVDLAGSESVRITGATGERLEESKKINQSLSCLGNVIAALTDVKPRSHIPYRDSKLTRLLKDSLGGNCKTTMMMMVSPAPEAFSETASTLKFGMRAKKIKNDARINEDVDQRALLRKYEVELRKLKQELERKSRGGGGDAWQVSQLEEEKRRAEEDKEAAINALEVRSREYMLEREEKMRLEEKIKLMHSQMLTGGKKIEETPQFRVALEKKHKQIREFYDEKLKEIERERNQIEEEKTQVDRYKQLLIKQRDIMIALTNRLNERDETIIQLQEELDAYDKIHRESEANIEAKSERIHILEDFIKDHGLEPPEGGDEVNSERANFTTKRYPPYQSDQIGDIEVPMKLMTPDEKIEELTQIIEEQKCHLETLEQERAELIDSKADFMSEKINEIVNREVNKELQRLRNNPNGHMYDREDEGEDGEGEYDEQQDEDEVEARDMDNRRNVHQEYEEDEEEENSYTQMPRGLSNKENRQVARHYPQVYESVDSYKHNQSDSRSSSYKPSQSNSSAHEKVYERRLPPNVEEMLKQKRQQMANRIQYQ